MFTGSPEEAVYATGSRRALTASVIFSGAYDKSPSFGRGVNRAGKSLINIFFATPESGNTSELTLRPQYDRYD